MLRMLVTGATGQIALSLKSRETSQIKIICVGRPELDLCNAKTIQTAIEKNRPDIVINAAAYTGVDEAETEVDLAYETNCRGAGLVAKECAKTGIPIIHVSTDYVFDGEFGEAYREDDEPGPANVYGKSKLCGEIEIRLANPRHIILRTAWVYSFHSKNFLKTMLRLSTENSMIRVVNDQYGSPSFAGEIADAIIRISGVVIRQSDEKSIWGIYHFTNCGAANWYEFALEIMRIRKSMNLPSSQIKPITTAMYPTRACRPKSSILNCDKIKAQFGIIPRHWKAALADCMVDSGN